MALFLFTKAILAGQPIDIFNHGKMVRDFTYIDDIVQGTVLVADKLATPNPAFDPANPDPASSTAPYRVFNIGNSIPTPLLDYIKALESAMVGAAFACTDWATSADVPKGTCLKCDNTPPQWEESLRSPIS